MAGAKILKPVAGAVILLGLYAAAGYLGVPAGVRWAVSNVIPDLLGGREASVGDVSFDPWNWTLSVRDLSIKSAHAPENNLLSLKDFSADLSAETLFKLAPVVESVTVDGLDLHLTANEANNEEALEAVQDDHQEASSSAGALPAFSLSNVRVTNSNVRLSNPQNGADVKITDIDFALPLLSTLPTSTKANVNPKLSLKIDDTPIQAQGTLKGQTASMSVKIDNLNAAKLLKAAPVTLPVIVDKATASCNLNISFEMPDSGMSALKVGGTAALSDLSVRDLKNKPFVSVKSASVNIKEIDVSTQKADVTDLKIVNPTVNLSVSSQNKIEDSKSTGANSGSTSEASGNAWKWSLTNLEISNGSIQVTDTGLKPAAALSATAVNLSAKNLSSSKDRKATFSANATVAQGKLSSSGTLTVNPLAVNASTQIKSMQFASFNPWIKALAGAQLTKGAADVSGKLDMKSEQKLALKWSGDLSVSNLEAKNAAGKTLMTWTQAKATGVDVRSIEPVDIAIRNLTVKEPAKKATQNVSKAAGLIGAIAALTGHENTAERAQKAAKVVSSDISLSNIAYKDGKFQLTEKNKQALSALLVESLNSVFATESSSK